MRFPVAVTVMALVFHARIGLGATYAQSGALASAYTLAAAIIAPFRGRLLDAQGLRVCFIPSLIGLPIAWGIGPFVSYPWLFACAILAGVCNPPIHSVLRKAIAVHTCEDQRQTAYALDSVIVELSFVLAPMLATYLCTRWDSRWTIVVFQLMVYAGVLVLFAMNPLEEKRSVSTPKPTAHKTGTLRPGWVSPASLALLISMTGIACVIGGADIAIIEKTTSLGDTGLTGVYIGILAAGSIVGGIAYGAFNKPIPPAWLALPIAVTLLACTYVDNPILLGVLILCAGFFSSPAFSATADYLSRTVPKQRMGEVMGWHGGMGNLGSALSATAVGVAIDILGGPAGFVFTAFMGFAIILLSLFVYAFQRRPLPAELAATAAAGEVVLTVDAPAQEPKPDGVGAGVAAQASAQALSGFDDSAKVPTPPRRHTMAPIPDPVDDWGKASGHRERAEASSGLERSFLPASDAVFTSLGSPHPQTLRALASSPRRAPRS